MHAETKQTYWTEFFKLFGKHNKGRRTRLGVFEDGNDYWLEDGLPFIGIDEDVRREMPSVEIMLEGFTHTIKSARKLQIILTADGDEDGLDITDAEGKTSILRFEKNENL